MIESMNSIVLPEDVTPEAYAGCSKCELAEQRHRVIWGEGTPGARIMIILDNPGAREDREGNVFVCGTRDTLQRGLQQAGIDLDDVYVTYILKCRPLRKYDKPLARQACHPYLDEQLELYKPELLFCLGDVATQTLFDDPETSVKILRGAWRTAKNRAVAVSYHPLAVRRRPGLYPLFASDCQMIAERVNLQISREIIT